MKAINDKGRYYKSLFMTYFDGCYDIEPTPNTSNTYSMGVCRLEFNYSRNSLIVHLRRPGLLIGKGGIIIDSLKKHLGIDVEIIEVNITK